MISREEVYLVIDEERDYQDRRWGPEDTEGKHSVTEFVAFMGDYMDQARHECSRHANPEADQLALATLRKVVAMGVACMEQNGVVRRDPEASDAKLSEAELKRAARRADLSVSDFPDDEIPF